MRWLMLMGVLLAAPAWASKDGIAADVCAGCHGGPRNTTTLTVTPSTFSPGDVVTLTVTMTGAGSVGGFFIYANYNTFTLINGQGTRLLSGGVTHTTPKAAVGGKVTFEVNWRAPATPDGYQFHVGTVLGNGDDRSAGDGAGEAELEGVFGCTGTTYFRDFDADGVGSLTSGTRLGCSVPAGYSALENDCNDNDERVKPNGVELCNRADDNCNGQVDEGLEMAQSWPDVDQDGYGAATAVSTMGCLSSMRVSNNLDCKDDDRAVHPGASEVCNNRDDNCDGQFDEGVQVICGIGLCRRRGETCNLEQCVPGVATGEKCNLLDDDCDGFTDEGDICPAGHGCQEGRCVEGVVPTPDPSADAGVGGKPVPTDTCASVPGLLTAVGVLVLFRSAARRRSMR